MSDPIYNHLYERDPAMFWSTWRKYRNPEIVKINSCDLLKPSSIWEEAFEAVSEVCFNLILSVKSVLSYIWVITVALIYLRKPNFDNKSPMVTTTQGDLSPDF